MGVGPSSLEPRFSTAEPLFVSIFPCTVLARPDQRNAVALAPRIVKETGAWRDSPGEIGEPNTFVGNQDKTPKDPASTRCSLAEGRQELAGAVSHEARLVLRKLDPLVST